MNVVNTNNIYRIYNDSLKTYPKLPARAYQVNFDKQSGFYLSGYDEITIDEKIYGVHPEKVNKVLNSFKTFDRNLGVILSGAKGIGKTLFGKMLSIKGIEKGYPLIIVNQYIPGIADYLNSIHQEIVVLFDEFDKTFYLNKNRDSMEDPQTEMLTLFDGLSQGKKLFIITCNELINLNDYLVNRPGRFHYHFRFDYPDGKQIKEYLEDKIPEEAFEEINKVINFSKKVSLNYDCLRAIAFELSLGETFENAIKDLNIVNLNRELYDLVVYFKDGEQCQVRDISLNLFRDDSAYIEVRDSKKDDITITFNPSYSEYSSEKDAVVIKGSFCDITSYIDYKTYNEIPEGRERKIDYILINRKPAQKNMHYFSKVLGEF